MKFSVCTPTYNRCDCLSRVYESLKKQSLRDFEWIIVDDGSSDETKSLVEEFAKQADFKITYFYKENGGKHTAVNKAVSLAEGDFIVIADSDDEFTENALEALLEAWEEIPEEKRHLFRGITCRCYDPATGKKIGEDFPEAIIDSNELEAKFSYGFQYEMWGMIRREVMMEYPFPEPEGTKMRFFPESVIWDRMARTYQTRYIDVCLRGYYMDQENATTAKKADRSAENIWLWSHYINDIDDYFKKQPTLFLKAYVGLARDGKRLGKSYTETKAMIEKGYKKGIFTLFYPAGAILAHR